jgi:cell division protein FtsW
MQRISASWIPGRIRIGKGYQLSHALIAFGRGEWLGVGLGGSVEKLFYLPEAHTDFLLAVIAEELGFAGWLSHCSVRVDHLPSGVRDRSTGRDARAFIRGTGRAGHRLWLGVQAIINMGVNMGVLPTKGLTLPLMSFGGSAIVANCMAIAILLRIDWENRQMQRGFTV